MGPTEENEKSKLMRQKHSQFSQIMEVVVVNEKACTKIKCYHLKEYVFFPKRLVLNGFTWWGGGGGGDR